jgi:hypothetical protein
MIRRELKSQVNDLEKRIAAAVQAKRDEVDLPIYFALMHSTRVAAVALYGEPKIEEPLRIAQSRMIEKLHKEFAAAAEELWIRKHGKKPNLFVRDDLYCCLMFVNLRGGNDNSKFEQIFLEAPAWLLKFTAVEWDANLLGFKRRELVGAPALGRQARLDRNCWPNLPSETIDAGGPCSEPDEPWEKIVERRCHSILNPCRSE